MQKKSKDKPYDDKRKIYLANVSHEIRTPMNAIVGLSDMLQKIVKDPEEAEYLKSMETATKTLLMTINNILDYENMLDGNITINQAPFDVASLINEVLSIAKINIGDKKVKLLADIDAGLPAMLIGDETRIKQILVHLLSNADKFTKEGYIRFSVKSESNDKEEKIFFSVEDTGKGIKEDAITRMFKAYEQENNSSSRKEGGLGIGLTIAKVLLELMGSSLNIESKEGKGTKVSFTLKLKNLKAEKIAKVDVPEAKHVALYIQDKEEEKVLLRMFEGLGVSTVSLSNMGEIFVEYEKRHITHFLLSHEQYLQVREIQEVKDLGITFVDMIDSAKEIFEDNNTLFIHKPVWFEGMAALLNGEGIRGSNEGMVSRKALVVVGARVLAVDDNDINLKVTKGLLRPYGLTVDTASSGEEALKFVTRTRYDLIFMDHMMPEMDGVEATKRIREMDDPYYKALPIVALSANAIEGVDKMFKDAGMNDFLSKPMEIKQLEEILVKWIPKEKISYTTVEEGTEVVPGNEFSGFKRIDVSKGLSYTNGNVYMYRSLVKDYAASIEGKREMLNNLIKDGDINRFTIEVHALKSSSKILGAMTLSDKALELERLGHKRDLEKIKVSIDGLNNEIDYIIEDLRPFAKDEEENVKKLSFDREKVRELLRKLYYAADDFDYETSKEIISGIGNYKLADEIAGIHRQMKESIEDIDYKETARCAIEMLARV